MSNEGEYKEDGNISKIILLVGKRKVWYRESLELRVAKCVGLEIFSSFPPKHS